MQTRPFVKSVRLDINNIKLVPEDAFALNPLLAIIDLSHNRISNVSERIFTANPHLQELILDGNMLTYLPPLLLANNPALKVFSAGGNKLKSIPENIFWHNPQLQEVHLADNRIGISGIPKNLFKYNAHLQTVFLSGNLLKKLPMFLFHGAPMISHIYLEKNELQTVHPQLFQHEAFMWSDQQPNHNKFSGLNENDPRNTTTNKVTVFHINILRYVSILHKKC